MDLGNTVLATAQDLDVHKAIQVGKKDRNFFAAAQPIQPGQKTVQAQPTPQAIRESQRDANVERAKKAGLSPDAQRMIGRGPSVSKMTRARVAKLGLNHSTRALNNSQNPKLKAGKYGGLPLNAKQGDLELNPSTRKEVPIEQSHLMETLHTARHDYNILKNIGKVASMATPEGALTTVAGAVRHILMGSYAPAPSASPAPKLEEPALAMFKVEHAANGPNRPGMNLPNHLLQYTA
jgi:hypothetical protein